MERWSVAPLRPERRDEVVALFDAARLASAPQARERGACCCNLYALPRAIDFAALAKGGNRTATASRIEVGEQDGYVALAQDRAIAFLNVQPRHRAPHCFDRLGLLPPPVDVAAADAAVALCLVTHPDVDARSIGPVLVAGAVAALAARGFRVVDAFPLRDATGDEPHAPGCGAWYEAAGLSVVGEHDARLHLRRAFG
jgi:hypothetical protein